jgi:hypothetical protein
VALNDFTRPAFDRQEWCFKLGSAVVRWFPGSWTLKQRRNREMFTAKVEGLPETIAKDPLLHQDFDKQDRFFKDFGFCSYKVIKQPNGRSTLIGYFSTYESLKTALETPFVVEKETFRWVRSSNRANKSGGRKKQKKDQKMTPTKQPPKTTEKGTGGSKSNHQSKQDKNKSSRKSKKGAGGRNKNDNKAEIIKLLVSLLV